MSTPTFLGSAVLDLFKAGGPANVSRFVVPIVVDPVESVLRTGLRADVVEERLEVVHPLVADGDPASAVVLPSREPWSDTTLPHVVPGGPFGRSSLPVSGAKVADIRFGSLGRQFTGQASARLDTSASDICAVGHRGSTTVALAQPPGDSTICASVVGTFDDNDPAEALSGEVYESHESMIPKVEG